MKIDSFWSDTTFNLADRTKTTIFQNRHRRTSKTAYELYIWKQAELEFETFNFNKKTLLGH